MNRISLIASNGETIEIWEQAAGLETGFGRVVHPYYDFVEGLSDGWRHKDGETVVAAQAGERGAMPIADAYQRLQELFDRETFDIASYEYEEILAGSSPEAWGTVEEWRARYPERVTLRVEAPYRAALAAPEPLKHNPFAALAA